MSRRCSRDCDGPGCPACARIAELEEQLAEKERVRLSLSQSRNALEDEAVVLRAQLAVITENRQREDHYRTRAMKAELDLREKTALLDSAYETIDKIRKIPGVSILIAKAMVDALTGRKEG